MPISNVALTNTFDEWRTITNQLTTTMNDLLNDGATNITYRNFTANNVFANNINIGGLSLNSIFTSAFTQANTANATAIAAFGQANTVNIATNAAFTQVNTVNLIAIAAFGQANTANVTAIASFTQANTANATAIAAFNAANAAGSSLVVTSAFDQANTANATAIASFTQANTVNATAIASFTQANTVNVTANAAFTQANSVNVVANAAFAQANVANSTAIAAFAKANTGGGGGNFNTNISNAVGYVVTTSMASAYSAPSTAGLRYVVHSIHITNIGTANATISGEFNGTTYANSAFANAVPVPAGSSVELFKKPKVIQPSDEIRLREEGVDANLHATIAFETQTSTSLFGAGLDVTADATYTDLYTASGNAVIESILLSNDSSSSDVKARVVWTNASNVIQGYFCYDLIIPLQSTVELLEMPKFLASGFKVRVYANIGGRLEAIIAGKLI